MNQEQQFIAAISAHRAILFKVASLYTDHPSDREDLMQEMIYQLWKSFDSFSGKAQLSTWMYRVAMNTAIYQVKRKRRKPQLLPFSRSHPEPIQDDPNPLDEQWLLLQQHLQTLNPMEKSLILLHLEKKSYREIAEITGLSETNVGTRLSRVKQKIQASLSTES
ncbi:MAG: RNA polymerase sigma factor [Bacteroidota bacterium]